MARYAVSDLHGMYNLYKAIDMSLKDGDTIYFLGDACDRGVRSWETLRDIIINPSWHFIRGNHEQMLLDALREYKELDGMTGNAQELYYYNGGDKTLDKILSIGDSAIDWVISKIQEMPTHLELINKQGIKILLSHSGYRPEEEKKDYIWDRDHFRHSWPSGEKYKNIVMVHGHTPIPGYFMTEPLFLKDPGAYYYCGDRKINIDCGAVWTGYTTMLNLENFDETVFYVKPDENT